MSSKTFKIVGLNLLILSLGGTNAYPQGFLVDQASGTPDELIQVFTRLPDNQIAQSFTPLIPAVGFVQLQTFNSGNSSGETLVINLRQAAYNGAIIGSTTPEFLVNKITQINTFYFPGEVVLIPGQLYFFEPVLQSAGPLDVGIKFPSSYAGGTAWNNGLEGTGDYWFREGIVVPEPSAAALMGFGCGLVWLWRRSSRRN